MCDVPQLGALKKGTNEYIYPAAASKMDKYVCPDCGKDLILRRGQIRIHHFAHLRDDNPCTYYNKPSESQIHKDAKMLMKSLLDKKKQTRAMRGVLISTFLLAMLWLFLFGKEAITLS